MVEIIKELKNIFKDTFEYIKQNYYKIPIALLFAFPIFVLAFAFSTTTYAYTIDSNGNMISDNQFMTNDYNNNDFGLTKIWNSTTQTIYLNGTNTQAEGNGTFCTIRLTPGHYEFQSFYISGSCTGIYRIVVHNYGWNFQQTLVLNTNNNHCAFDISIEQDIIFDFYGNLNTDFDLYNHLSLSNKRLEQWEPYGVWYSESNYNAVVNDNEELQEQINTRNTKELQSGIKANLNGTYLKTYNQDNMTLSQMLSTTPLHTEQIEFPTEDMNYNMQYCNVDTYNAIINNGGEFINGDTITIDTPTLLYTFKTPLYIESITFSRNSTEGTRYINLYFTDNTSTELILTESSDNNRTDILWTNDTNKYIEYISTTAEVNYNVVYTFTIPNGSQIYTNGYEQGYSDGMYEQYQQDAPIIQNANQNLQAKYQQGYNDGWEKGANTNNSLYNMVIAIADTPIHIFKSIFNFNILGIDISGFIFGIVSLLIIIWLIKKII